MGLSPCFSDNGVALVDQGVVARAPWRCCELSAHSLSSPYVRSYVISSRCSTTGKRLLAKCKLLMEENSELGRQLSEGTQHPQVWPPYLIYTRLILLGS